MVDEPKISPAELLKRARERARRKDYAAALADYSEFLSSAQEDLRARLERGRVRLISGDAPGALEDLNRILQAKPQHIPALLFRARAAAPLDPQTARTDYETVASLNPVDALDFLCRGYAREALNRSQDAKADFERAQQLAGPNHPDIEEIKEQAPGAAMAPRDWRHYFAPVTILLAIANVTVMALHPKLMGQPSASDLVAAGALERYHVWSGEYWRLFTAMFLHIGAAHLVWNTYASFGWCAPIERELGWWKFLICYLATGIAASATSLLCHHVVAAGSSGAAFGIIGVTVYSIKHRLGGWGKFLSDRQGRSIVKTTAIWLVLGISFVSMDNYAHFGGLVFGLVMGWLVLKVPGFSTWGRRLAWGFATTMLVSLCLGASIPSAEVASGIFLSKGAEAAQRGDHAAAERFYSQAVSAGDPKGVALIGRGFVREQLGNLDAAMSDFDEAVRRSPQEVKGYWGRGNVYYRRKDYSSATDAYTAALNLSPDNVDVRYLRGCALMGLERYSPAISDLEAAIRSAPGNWAPRREAEKLLSDLRSRSR
jgi:rhomboid protease GluP